MSDLNRLADLLLPGIRNAQLKLEEVSNYLSAMPNSLRHYDGWQPIETAPKDHWVLVYEPGWHLMVAKWVYDDQWRYAKSDDGVYLTCRPTYWMELQEAPK